VRKNLNNDQPRVYFKSEKGKMKANSLKNNVRQFGQYVEVVANRKTFQDQFFCLTLLTAKTF